MGTGEMGVGKMGTLCILSWLLFTKWKYSNLVHPKYSGWNDWAKTGFIQK